MMYGKTSCLGREFRVCAVGAVVCVSLVFVSSATADFTVDDPKTSYGTLPEEDVPWVQQGTSPTCWLASAANVLAAAGWGTGANAQARADAIYQQLRAHYGETGGKDIGGAMTWWLRQHGSAGSSPYYAVSQNSYTIRQYKSDGRIIGGATRGDYLNLKAELENCQYIAVGWTMPIKNTAGNWTTQGHAMTMVAAEGTGGQSGWHDSNGDKVSPAGSVDAYDNQFVGTNEAWELDGLPYSDVADSNHQERAEVIAMLCPGKPRWATEQYDALWSKTNGWTVSGDRAPTYGCPGIDEGGLHDDTTLYLPNAANDDAVKELYVELIFNEPQNDGVALLNLLKTTLTVDTDDEGCTIQQAGSWWMYANRTKVLAQYRLDPQPGSEFITLGPDLYSRVSAINVATYCIPEPATLSLIVLGGLLLMRRAKQRGHH